MKIRTWEDLARAIAAMTPEERLQPVQCVNPTPNDNDVQECLPGIAFGTVAELQFYACRSSHNNKYCSSDFVLLVDGNPFAEDGAIAYEWDTEVGDLDEKPIYGSDGKTDRSRQIATAALPTTDEELPSHVWHVVEFRSGSMNEKKAT